MSRTCKVVAFIFLLMPITTTFDIETIVKRYKRNEEKTLVAFSDADADTFITQINQARSLVLPIATQMPCLTYSLSLAATAQIKADSCDRTSRTNTQALSFDNSQRTLSELFKKWSNEDYDAFNNACFDKEVPSCADYKACFNDQSTTVGCANANCNGGFFTVCEFSAAINPDSAPYGTGGAACSRCPSTTSCVNKLCCNAATTSSSTTSTSPTPSTTSTSPTPSTSRSSSETSTTTAASTCVDVFSNCTANLCLRKGVYLESCKKTCANCDGCKCVDTTQTNINCTRLSNYTYCKKYVEEMSLNCPLTCKMCAKGSSC